MANGVRNMINNFEIALFVVSLFAENLNVCSFKL